jgi:creatinine amidohydrolase
MGVYADRLTDEVRLERMRPAQIEAAKARRAAIYVPFGALEWHGYHNPVGLDGLKAHEQLVGLALRAGGVVYPPVYFGSGGGHGAWPHSYMVSAEPMSRIVAELLVGFERDGYRAAILVSGHYPNRKEYLDAAVTAYMNGNGTMRVLAIVENQIEGIGGDHAAKYETSAMMFLDPSTQDLSTLKREPTGDAGGPEERINWMGEAHRGHPCYGLVGVDPRRHATVSVGRDSTERLINALAAWLEE